ncbi:glutaredoxin family protein [Halopseudomonas maritima]|uniref:glutaredoxin family protein n=1 Tax=Halopseudomonas maritima TaxID=2918528 RepID=UPI001EEA3E6D|nr:glutaredoxin family protein [Halopseudomonas maritima]UJJ31711.1 glutaredoxin family protein [Halopseudomonas maritima]
MLELTLYGTLGCHLCDAALAELAPLANTVSIRQVDIADSEALMARYQLRIPVLQRSDTGAELDWPFDLPQLMDWLADHLREEG